jgi:hypothetical protein
MVCATRPDVYWLPATVFGNAGSSIEAGAISAAWLGGPSHIVSVAVIVAVGVDTDGRREMLGMTVDHSEAEPFLVEFLRTLTRRGRCRVVGCCPW